MPSPPNTAHRGDACRKCGQVHQRCFGHNRAGLPCGMNPARHQEVCRLHGGGTPGALVHAKARELQEAAEAAVRVRWAVNGDVPVDDPLSELARVAGEAVAWKDFLRDQVATLNGLLTYWEDRDFVGLDGEILRSQASEQLRAIVVAYERSQDRAAKILATMVKLDLAGRLLELRTEQAALIVSAVRTGLATVDLEQAVRSAALEAIADQLEKITQPGPVLPAELTASP